MSRREKSQVLLKSDKKNGLFSLNTKFWPSLAEVIFQTVLLSIFKVVFSTKCSKKNEILCCGDFCELDFMLWGCGVLGGCGDVKISVCLSFNIGQWSVHYWLPVLLSIPLEQIWSCWVVSGEQQRILPSEFPDRHVPLVMGSAACRCCGDGHCYLGAVGVDICQSSFPHLKGNK